MPRKIPKNLPTGKTFTVERGLWVRRLAGGSFVWGISYGADGETYRETIGPSKTVAREALAARKADIARGRFDLTRHVSLPRFSDFVDTYTDYAKQHKRSWKRDEQVLGTWVTFLGAKRLNRVTAWDIETHKAARRKQVSPATVNRELSILKRVFNLARKWCHDLHENPVDSVRFFKEPERAIRVLSAEEESGLMAAAAPHLRPIISLALNTGLRRGELLDLDWRSVDLHQKIVTVEHSKSGRIRHVPLNPAALDSLRGVPGKHGGPVFTFRDEPIASVKKAFRRAVERAKIPRCRFHDLRHTFATRLVLAGVDLPTVKELLGHASITTTMQYAHPGPKHKRDAVNSLKAAHQLHIEKATE